MRKHNLHTHTNYSDGEFPPEKLVETAEKRQLEILGISDHAFTRKMLGYQITSNIEQYLTDLERIRSKAKLDLKIGVEIDVSRTFGIEPSQLPFAALNEFDYVLFEYVETECEQWGRVGSRNISEVINIREKLDVPIGLAHNDLQNNFRGGESDIAGLLSTNDIFVELCQSEAGRNSRNGKDYYQHFSKELLKQLVLHEVKVVAGTDFHGDLDGLGNLEDVYKYVRESNLQYHGIAL